MMIAVVAVVFVVVVCCLYVGNNLFLFSGEGQNENIESSYGNDDFTCKYSNSESSSKDKIKLLMNPQGKVQDLKSLTKQGIVLNSSPLSPEMCFDLVKDLTTTKGKGL